MHTQAVWASRFNFVVGLCLIGAAGFVIVSGMRSGGPQPDTVLQQRLDAFMKEPIRLDPAKTTGSVSAPLVMVAYIDFDCPACKAFSRTVLPDIRQEFVESGALRFSVRHLPIESIHKTATEAAVASECAARQGGFWPFHDALVSSPERSENYYRKLVTLGNLNTAAFDACQATTGPDEIREDVERATAAGLQVTPLFFIGRHAGDEVVKLEKGIVGNRPLAEFQAMLRSLR